MSNTGSDSKKHNDHNFRRLYNKRNILINKINVAIIYVIKVHYTHHILSRKWSGDF